MRTLTFGDRTISYDAGLDTFHNDSSTRTSSTDVQYEMTERKVSVAKSESADSGVGADADTVIDNQDDSQEYIENERRVIKPDDIAVRQLLNFDEEEEDEYYEEESDFDEDDAQNRSKEVRNQSLYNKKWRQAIVKDLTRSNTTVNVRTGTGHSPPGLTRSDSLDQVLTSDQSDVKLSLREVGHIRRVLARAELETCHVSPELRSDLEAGHACAVCHKTRFGRLSRGMTCDLCSVKVCNRCVDTASRVSSDTLYDITDIPQHLLAPATLMQDMSGDNTRHNCAGSAPNSPQTRRSCDDTSEDVSGDQVSGQISLPLHPPPVTSRSTLPRRWSMAMWSRQEHHEDMIRVCLLCKNMIKQILRTKGYNKRM